MREGTAGKCRLMSRAVVLMVPRVWRGVAEGRLESGEEGHGVRIWSRRRNSGDWRMEMEMEVEAETATPCAFMWPS